MFVYFDLGNVLLHFDHEVACRNMAQVSGVSIDRVREVVFQHDLDLRYNRGQLDSRGFHAEFCRLSGAHPPFESLLWAASDMFTLNTPMVPLVAQLRAVGHKLGILSNTCAAHWEFVSNGRYCLVPEYFETRALSYELGTVKPEPEIYAAAAQLAGTPPGEIFFVDDREENVAAARNAGYMAVRYQGVPELARELRQRGILANY